MNRKLFTILMLAGVFGGLPPMPEPPMKRKCLLTGCENLTAHNGGYCCAEHCRNHKNLKQPNVKSCGGGE